MKFNDLHRCFAVLLIVGTVVACTPSADVNDNGSTKSNGVDGEKMITSESKTKLDIPASDHRLRVETTLVDKKVVLILNREDVPIGSMTDFYLKVEGAENSDVVISTDVKQGFVSKNKEPFYFGVKGVEGAEKIDLQILVTDETGERSPIGVITIPTELKK